MYEPKPRARRLSFDAVGQNTAEQDLRAARLGDLRLARRRVDERLELDPLDGLEVLRERDLAALRARLRHVLAEELLQLRLHLHAAVPRVEHVRGLVDRDEP